MASTTNVAELRAGLKIALEYFNRSKTTRGRAQNAGERLISRKARNWACRYFGRHPLKWSQVSRFSGTGGAFDAVHPDLFRRKVDPDDRWRAWPRNPRMPSAARRRPELTYSEYDDIVDSRILKRVRPPGSRHQLVSARDLAEDSEIFDYLPEFLIALGGLWGR